MKRIAVAALVLGVIVLGLLALLGLREVNREGELAFSPESTDLGQVPLGKKAPFRFEMRNVGAKPVKLTKLQISAKEGC